MTHKREQNIAMADFSSNSGERRKMEYVKALKEAMGKNEEHWKW